MFTLHRGLVPLIFLLANTALMQLNAMTTNSYFVPIASPVELAAYDQNSFTPIEEVTEDTNSSDRPIRVFGYTEALDEAAASAAAPIFEPTRCCICIDGRLCREDEVLACDHAFHTNCITRWMKKPGYGREANTCPICRQSIVFLRPMPRRHKPREKPLSLQASRERKLVIATRNKCLTEMQRLLESGVKANVPNYKHATLPLIIACQMNRVDMVELLLSHYANTDAQDCEDNTALAAACWHKATDIKIIEALLDAGASVDVMNHRKQTPIADACKNGRADIVRRLLSYNPIMDKETRTAVEALVGPLIQFVSPAGASSITAFSDNDLNDDQLTI